MPILPFSELTCWRRFLWTFSRRFSALKDFPKKWFRGLSDQGFPASNNDFLFFLTKYIDEPKNSILTFSVDELTSEVKNNVFFKFHWLIFVGSESKCFHWNEILCRKTCSRPDTGFFKVFVTSVQYERFPPETFPLPFKKPQVLCLF